jgi:hypothetical protein
MLKITLIMMMACAGLISWAEAGAANGKVVKAADFGAVGDGITDDGPALRRAVAAAAKLGANTRLALDKGVYRLDQFAGVRCHLELKRIRGLTIDGNGSTLLLHPRNSAFDLYRCTNVVVRGFVIDFDPLTFTQGTIAAIDPEAGTFDLNLHPDYPLPPPDDLLKKKLGEGGWRWGTVMDPVARHRRWGMADHFFIESVNMIKERTCRITVTRPYAAQLRPVRAGDRFFLPLLLIESEFRAHGHNIVITESNNCTVEDVTIHTARSGMNYLLSRNEGRVTLRNNRIAFKPDSTHICTSWRDGVHCKDNRVGPLIEGCFFEGMLDDSINISANTAMATEIISENEFVLTGPRFSTGDDVMVFDTVSGKITAETKVLSARPVQRNWRVTLAAPVSDVITGTKRQRADIRATHFYNMSYVNTGFVVRNCTFKPQRRHALLIRSSNGVFENNLVDGVGGAAVWMSNESGGFYEGPFPQNNVIRNNTIKNTQLAAINIATVSVHGSIRHTRDITVENNTIVSLPDKPAVTINCAENITLRNNKFFDAQGKRVPDQAALSLKNASKVEINKEIKLLP